MNAKKYGVLIIGVVLLSLVLWTIWGNTALQLNEYIVSSDKLPVEFEGYRIAQISDLHNAEFGEGNSKLLELLKKAEPDVIVMTGDLIDSRNTKIQVAIDFAKEAVKIAPCYYVTGNHEGRIAEHEELITGLEEAQVHVLTNEVSYVERDGAKLAILGVNDPSFQTDYLFGDDESVVKGQLDTLMREVETYAILLSHRPELFDIYVESGMNLVFSGHAHGGQFRIPFLGGLVAPNQGLFPKYDGGIYSLENTTMVVSRGIGNSILPIRFNNRPEVILIELSNIG